MDLGSFLCIVKTKPYVLTNYHSVAFQSKEYPLYFFYSFIKKLKDCSSLDTVVCETTEVSHTIAQLQTSFLGTSCIYWLKDLDQLSTVKRKALLEFLSDYAGPHTVLFYTTASVNQNQKNSILVNLDDVTTKSMADELGSFFDIKIPQLQDIIKRKQVKLTLDESCLLLHYMMVLGGNYEQFFDEWFPKIVAIPSSLFVLSQYFFAKDSSQFFIQWSSIEGDYSEPFWVTFWSDQLWRAYFYVLFSLQKNVVLGNQISARLPFSFLRCDWRSYASPHELKNAHNFIYELDFNIKNATAGYGLDLFYSKFFLHQFRSV